MSFQPSININYDIGKEQLFEQYVPNTKQLNIINGMLNNLVDDEHHAHLLVGPYGAGKSMVGAMFTSLLTQPKLTKATKRFLKDIHTVSPSLELELQDSLANNKIRWIPVPITGKSGDFESIILESIQKRCDEYDITLTLKHDAIYILDLVKVWKLKYPDVYSNLLMHLQKVQYEEKDFMNDLRENMESAVGLFKHLYSEIAFGTPYHNPNTIEFTEQLDYIFQQLDRKKVGLLIVFDEFGRFLQTVSSAKIYETMQHIQDLAELSNRRKNAFLLMITHTGLQQYSNVNTSLTQGELERVEKRFLEHRLESDSAIFYRAAHKLLKKPLNYQTDMFLATEYEKLNYSIMKYNLFPDMTVGEIEGTIVDGCQPIHPLTIQLLPGVSNILGQNDRTLYMFLNEFKVEENEGKWYYADRLFDYFYPDESMILTLDALKYYRIALSYKVSTSSLRVVKLATLLNLVNNRFPIIQDFLQFALDITEAEANESIRELVEVKLLRLNPFSKTYELYEGSMVAFEDIYKEVENTLVLTDTMRIHAVEKMYGEKYFLPLGYNTAKSMTRYIETKFAFGESSIETELYEDGKLLYVLSRNQREHVEVLDRIKEYREDNILFALVNLDFSKLSEPLNQYLVLSKMLDMPELLKEDTNLKKEIILRIESVVFSIQKLLQPLITFDEQQVKYYLAGCEISISSNYQFDEFLDKWMFERFPYTPEVRNESFNKKSVMPIQRKSALNLLTQILQPTFDGTFEIIGTGPDYLIYATTFKNLNFNFTDLDIQPTQELAILRSRLLSHLEQSKRNSIYSLYEIALEKPFGIRASLVPLIVGALLKDKLGQMAFYSNDFSITEINAAMLYDILEQGAEFYEYEIYSLTDEIVESLSSLNKVYFDGESVIHPNILFKQLNKWLLSLPRFTQITDKQSRVVIRFKQLIRASESDPLTASKELVEMGLDEIGLKDVKQEIEHFIAEFIELLMKETLAKFDVSTVNEIGDKHREVVQQSPQLLELVQLLEKTNDITQFALRVVGVRLEDWSDITYASYFATLEQLLVLNDTESVRIMNGDQVVTTIQEIDLSVKGKTIFDQLHRIVTAGGRTMNPEEVKYILYRVLQEMK